MVSKSLKLTRIAIRADFIGLLRNAFFPVRAHVHVAHLHISVE
jgi:hypothetical protein